MKSLRIWLLVLLAIALPFRGAMAAAMLCAPGPAQGATSAAQMHEHAGHGVAAAHASHGTHAADAPHATAVHDHGDGAGHDDTGKCSFCATCCSATAPMTLTFTLPQAPPATAAFPDHVAPVAEFFSGGPERPPRTL